MNKLATMALLGHLQRIAYIRPSIYIANRSGTAMRAAKSAADTDLKEFGKLFLIATDLMNEGKLTAADIAYGTSQVRKGNLELETNVWLFEPEECFTEEYRAACCDCLKAAISAVREREIEANASDPPLRSVL